MNKRLIFKSFRNTFLAAIYIFIVSQIMQNGEKLFGKNANEAVSMLVVLLLFSLSAAVVGGLVFGESVIQLINNKKRDGILAAIFSVGWLAVYTVIGLVILLIF